MIPIVLGLGIAFTIFYMQQNRLVHATDQQPHRSNQCHRSPPNNTPKKIPKVYNTNCTICFENNKTKASSILKCGHAYHNDCLGELITKGHKKCPDCRKDIEFFIRDSS